MIHPFKSLAALFGSGSATESSDVPPFDHALKVNDLLGKATLLAKLSEPVDMISDGRDLLVADGTTVCRLDPSGAAHMLFDAGKPITAIGKVDDGVACALEGREVRIFGGRRDGKRYTGPSGADFRSVNALAFDGNRILATDGSLDFAPADWRHDLMKKGSTGRLIAIDPDTGASSILRSDLRYAFGAAQMGREVLLAESWAHRLVAVSADGKFRVVEADFPAYPARISPARDGYWLAMSCVRSELIEFVLRESEYRIRMMESIDPHLWIAPQLRSFSLAQESVQWGAVRQQGVIKAWAPARSYGLVIKLNAAGQAQYSFHCRTGGTTHGLLATAEIDGVLYILSRAERAIRTLDIAAAEQEVLQ